MRIFFVIFLFTQISTTVLAQKIADVMVSYPLIFQKNSNGVVDLGYRKYFVYQPNTLNRRFGIDAGWMLFNTNNENSHLVRIGVTHSHLYDLTPDVTSNISYGVQFAENFSSTENWSSVLVSLDLKLYTATRIGFFTAYNMQLNQKRQTSLLKFGVTLHI